ncbi:MAG: sulfatase-like hydrolase/transferase [Gemmatimonadota bacterium]|jgi:choline-sulfatase
MFPTRREFLRETGLAALAMALSPTASCSILQRRRPNLLFLFADDHTFSAIRALGNDEVFTPNLDRLIKAGTTFTHAYNQGGWGGAICIASRTMLTTGRFLWNAHALESTLEEEARSRRMWPQLLEDAGYETYMSGKWHVNVDPASVFNRTGVIRPGMPQDTPEGYDRPRVDELDPWSPSDPRFGGYWEGGRHWSEVLADEGEVFIREAVGSDKPFFMYLAFNAPHDPRQSPQVFVDRYPIDDLDVPENFLPEYPFAEDMGAGRQLRDERLAPFPRTEHAVLVNRQEYYAIITHLDEQIGRILAALEASGEAENTVILFTADHGLGVGQHGLMGKQNQFDHSVRVPLVIAGPDIPTGMILDTPVYLQDVMPTTLELAGIPIPEHVQFRSFMPLVRGREDESYQAIYGGYRHLQRMVTRGDYKLVLYPSIEKRLLFNLREDPLEMRNLAEDPDQAERIDRMMALLVDLQRQTGDTLRLPGWTR